MTIFKYLKDNKEYVIEIIQSSYPFLDGSSRLGVWAYPYLHEANTLFFNSIDFIKICPKFVEDNFIKIGEANHDDKFFGRNYSKNTTIKRL